MMRRVTATVVVAAAVALGVAVTAAGGNLVTAKKLYASAAYEDALAELTAAGSDGDQVEQVEQYRALCLIALGRSDEAAKSLDRLLTRNPLYRLPDGDVSPRLVVLFKEARLRVLPTAAKARYAKAKAHFDERDFSAAAKDFRELLAIIDDPGADGVTFGDLQQLASGFLTLSEASLPPASPAPTSEPETTTVGTAAGFYTSDDGDVLAPIELERSMPKFTLPRSIGSYQFKGALAVVIDETGRVESARMMKPTLAAYDRQLLSATRTWHFRPATKNGVAVKYRKVYSIVLVSSS